MALSYLEGLVVRCWSQVREIQGLYLSQVMPVTNDFIGVLVVYQ